MKSARDQLCLALLLPNEDEVAPGPSPAADLNLPQTLADVRQRIAADQGLRPVRRRDLVSALTSFATHTRTELDTVQASFTAVRVLAARVMPGGLGVSAKRWANIKAELAFALRHVGVRPRPGRPASHGSAPWQALQAAIPDLPMRFGLARFVTFCANQAILPGMVDDAVLERFHASLREGTLVADPARVHRVACAQWNRAGGLVPGWPPRRVTVPCRTSHVRLPPATFEDSFHADVAAWQACLAGQDLFEERGPARPLSPATLRHVRYQVMMAASACIRAGVEPQELRSLADLVEPARLKPGLLFLIERYGGTTTAALGELASTLVYVARHWVQLAPARLQELERMRTRLRCRTRGMTEKNRTRLHQFDEPLSQLQLLDLPQKLLGLAEKQRNARKAAHLVQTGLMLLLLQMAPVRLRNLQGLHHEQHLLRPPGRRRSAGVRLLIRAEETKNGQALDYPLPAELVRVLDLYLTRHRRHLVREVDEGWLFPGQDGGRKHVVSLAMQIKEAIRRHLGLAVNPHLFRHLAAKFLLQASPGSLEAVRQLLGHKSLETTALYYAEIDTAWATTVYQEQLLERTARLRGGRRRG